MSSIDKANISIKNKDLEYSIRKDKNIIQSSIEEGIKLPYSCRSGVCGTCKAKLIRGKIDKENSFNHALSEEDIKKNIFLACQSKAISRDIEIELISPLPIQSDLYKNMKPRNIIAEVITARQITPLVKEIGITISRNNHFLYEAGMSVELVIPDITPNREYSIVDSPDENGNAISGILRFLVACHNNSKASAYIKKKIYVGDIITINGPFGNFSIPIKIKKPILALVGGTGISPVLSLMQKHATSESKFPIMLVSSFRNREEILMMEELQKLSFKNNMFSFKITLTREKPKNESRFLYGRIPTILNRIFVELNEHIILISGSPQFVEDCLNKVKNLNADEKNIYIEAFNSKT